MAGFLQNLWNGLAPRYKTDEEREADELQAESNELWGNVMDEMPDLYGLQGYGFYGGQVPDEYIQDYVDQIAQTIPGVMPPELIPQLQEQARQQYIQEQLARDPLWGLQVNPESALADAAADPAAIQAQRDMLSQMEGIISGGGYTDAERAQMALLERDAANFERSQRLATLEGARSRGMGGGGMELMGALAAQQGGANRASESANRTAIEAQQRMLQAMEARGQMGSQMRGQSFAEDSARRSAEDAWNQYITGQIRGRQDQYARAVQQQFGNLMDATAGATDQYMGASGNLQAQSAANTQQAMNTAGNVAGAVMTGIGYAMGGPAGGAAAGAIGGAMGRNSGKPGQSGYDLPGDDDEQQQPRTPTYQAPQNTQRNGGRVY